MRVAASVVVLLALAAVPGLLLARGEAAAGENIVAAVRLQPDPGATASGVAYFRQRGQTLSGWVAVWGLAPNTRHAVHFHGPDGACAGPTRDAVAAHRDLVADRRGVAFATFSLRASSRVLAKGIYYNVHARGAAAGKSPSIVCGDIRPELLR